jgi:hypothetical protein
LFSVNGGLVSESESDYTKAAPFRGCEDWKTQGFTRKFH